MISYVSDETSQKMFIYDIQKKNLATETIVFVQSMVKPSTFV